MAVLVNLASVLVILYMTLLSPSPSDGCMCSGQKTLQEHYCQSAFVIKAKILRKKAIFDKNSLMPEIPVAIRYSVKTFKVFKLERDNKTMRINEHEVFTGATSCGLDLSIDKTYAIAGKIRDGRLWAQTCEYAAQWSDLSPHQIKFITWKYRKHCGCSIRINRANRRITNRTRQSKQSCTTHTNQFTCYDKHSYCREDPERGNICTWKENKPLKACLNQLDP